MPRALRSQLQELMAAPTDGAADSVPISSCWTIPESSQSPLLEQPSPILVPTVAKSFAFSFQFPAASAPTAFIATSADQHQAQKRTADDIII